MQITTFDMENVSGIENEKYKTQTSFLLKMSNIFLFYFPFFLLFLFVHEIQQQNYSKYFYFKETKEEKIKKILI